MGIKPWHIIVLVVFILVLSGAILVLFGAKRLLDKLLDTPTKASTRSKSADASEESAPRVSGDPVDTGEAGKTSVKGSSAKGSQPGSDS